METKEKNPTFEDLEQQRILHSVLLLRDAVDDISPEYQQALNLEASHISEVLAGETRTKFEFESYDGKLFALQPDGVTDWQQLHENGATRARLRAEQNPRFNFYTQIAAAELEESRLQKQVIAAGEPATLFTMSLCGDDVASAEDLRLVGRDPELKRGYLRASVYDGHKLHLYSYSKDGLTLEEGRQIYKKHFGVEIAESANSIDILNRPVLLEGIHHDLLDRIAPLQGTDAYRFVLEQQDLLEAHLSGLQDLSGKDLPPPILTEQTNDLRYDIMSSFKQRLEGKWIDFGNLAQSVSYAGSVERASGTEFAGCDVIINRSQENVLAKAGYVNGLDLLKENWIWRDGYCQIKECPSRQPKLKKVKVGPCSVCRGCQHLFDSNKDPAREYKKVQQKKTSFWKW